MFEEGFTFARQIDNANSDDFSRVGFYKIEGFDMLAFNVYRNDVKGKAISCSVNGKQIFTREVPAGITEGAVGISLQNRRVEIRKIVVVR